MNHVLAYRPDGRHFRTTSDDRNLVSRLHGSTAFETWQIGYVRAQLAISRKTVDSLSALMKLAGRDALIQATYRLPGRGSRIEECLRVELAGPGLDYELTPMDDHRLSDSEIVQSLGGFWGEYLTATFSRITGHEVLRQPAIPVLDADYLLAVPQAARVRNKAGILREPR